MELGDTSRSTSPNLLTEESLESSEHKVKGSKRVIRKVPEYKALHKEHLAPKLKGGNNANDLC